MAPSTKTPNTREEQDSAYNPGELHANEQFGNIVNNYDKTADPSREESNIQKAQNWETNISKKSPTSLTSGGKFSATKKKGPLALIVGILLTGGIGITTLFTPGIGVVHFKEVFTGDLNDQLAGMDSRSSHVLRSRLKGSTRGICTNLVTIRCKFSKMSDRQIRKFRAAGITVVSDFEVGLRTRPTALIMPDGTRINAENLNRTMRRNPQARAAMAKAYNAKFMGFADKASLKGFRKLNITKSKKLTSTNREGKRDDMRRTTRGERADTRQNIVTAEDEDTRNRQQQRQGGVDEFNNKTDGIQESGNKSSRGTLRRGLGGGVRGIGVLGAVDSACTVYNTARAVSIGAKAARAIQLARYASIFLGTADAIKAGDATPEEVEFIGDILTQVDTDRTIFVPSNGDDVEIENPDFGKTAFDSSGFKIAAHGDIPTLSARSTQFMVGGITLGMIGNIDRVTSYIPGEAKTTCRAVQSWWGRGASIAAGVAAGIGTFGATAVASMSVSIGISLALVYLESQLADIAAGVVVDDDTGNVDAGDAVFAGTSVLIGEIARTRGLRPLQESNIDSYMALSNEIRQEYIAMEMYEAKSEPFNIYNQYSFTGRIARTTFPLVSRQNTTLMNISSIVTGSLGSVMRNTNTSIVHGAQQYNPERFRQCQDEEYNEMGIAADIFCNVRYGLSQAELALDPEEVVEFMLNNQYIIDGDEDADIEDLVHPDSDDFKNFVDYCLNRTLPYGDPGEDGKSGDKWATGERCMEDSTMLNHFRVFSVDLSVAQGMDDE
jgi:hypothetical protein